MKLESTEAHFEHVSFRGPEVAQESNWPLLVTGVRYVCIYAYTHIHDNM